MICSLIEGGCMICDLTAGGCMICNLKHSSLMFRAQSITRDYIRADCNLMAGCLCDLCLNGRGAV